MADGARVVNDEFAAAETFGAQDESRKSEIIPSATENLFTL